jgi:hypothetical protein
MMRDKQALNSGDVVAVREGGRDRTGSLSTTVTKVFATGAHHEGKFDGSLNL